MEDAKYILTKDIAAKKLRRMAFEIVERNTEEDHLILAGIVGNGIVIANIIRENLDSIFTGSVEVIELNINKKDPVEVLINQHLDYNGKTIILVDDVANSGKTMLYALKPFLDFKPKKIQTLVMVERMHKMFPINTDYVGLSVATTLQEHITVEVEGNEVMGAYLK